MDFSFDSVESFLRQANDAKQDQRETIDKGLEPLLDNPSAFSISPDIADLMERDLKAYGDETYKQLAAVAIGKWIHVHRDYLEMHLRNDSSAEAAMTSSDMSKLVLAVRLIEEVGSFNGDEEYRQEMKKRIGQAVLEHIEDRGRAVDSVFNSHDDNPS